MIISKFCDLLRAFNIPLNGHSYIYIYLFIIIIINIEKYGVSHD